MSGGLNCPQDVVGVSGLSNATCESASLSWLKGVKSTCNHALGFKFVFA